MLRILGCIGTFAAWGVVSVGPRPLDAPPLAVFNPRDHMRQEYREAVDRLCIGDGAFPPAVRALCELLNSTLNQQRLQTQLELAFGALQQDSSDSEGRELWLARLRDVVELVRGGHYVLSVPVEFDTDVEERVYRVSWPTWSGDYWRGSWTGPEVRRTVRFIPRMDLVVRGELGVSAKGEPAYGYAVNNGRGSEGDVALVWIECIGLNRERLELLRRRARWWAVAEGFVMFTFPQGNYLQDFILSVFGPDRRLVVAAPGQTLRVPTELSVPWRSLPGAVSCWVPVWQAGYPVDYPPGMDAEQDPADVTRIFWGGIENPSPEVGHVRSVPRFAFTGKTIGPVPIPEPTERAAFLGRVRQYLREAHVLLRYNLEYLAEGSHWKD
ncbi:MAG: hypothetical protein Kow001_19210 [Acidobacteriota bacterium]